MKKLLVYLKDYKLESIVGPLFKLLEACFELIVPLLVADVINNAIPNGDAAAVRRTALIMVLFAMLFMRCYKIIMGQSDLRDRFSAFGVTLVLAIGATLNLAVVMGMAPPKGVAMPFLSYGGSSLLASMMCIGLLLNFSRTAR